MLFWKFVCRLDLLFFLFSFDSAGFTEYWMHSIESIYNISSGDYWTVSTYTYIHSIAIVSHSIIILCMFGKWIHKCTQEMWYIVNTLNRLQRSFFFLSKQFRVLELLSKRKIDKWTNFDPAQNEINESEFVIQVRMSIIRNIWMFGRSVIAPMEPMRVIIGCLGQHVWFDLVQFSVEMLFR